MSCPAPISYPTQVFCVGIGELTGNPTATLSSEILFFPAWNFISSVNVNLLCSLVPCADPAIVRDPVYLIFHGVSFWRNNSLASNNPTLLGACKIQHFTWKFSIDKNMQCMACWLHCQNGKSASTQKWFRWTYMNTRITMESEILIANSYFLFVVKGTKKAKLTKIHLVVYHR